MSNDLEKKFVPKPDITTYELAQIVAGFHGHSVYFERETWDRLGLDVARHFEDAAQ